jgi:hypothetical protein
VNAFDEKRYQKGQKNFHELDQRLLASRQFTTIPFARLRLQLE